eukprot:COSAG01_NODE_4611_length_4879_cov_9.632845_2_plen_562_part_00
MAAVHGDVPGVQAELRAGVNPDLRDGGEYTALHYAAEKGHAAVVGALVGGGAAVGAVDERGVTALHTAAAYGQAAMVGPLVGAGAGVDAATKIGHTPLSFAAKLGQTEVVAALLGAGADATRPTDEGKTAAEWARKEGHPAVAELIEAHLAQSPPAAEKAAAAKEAAEAEAARVADEERAAAEKMAAEKEPAIAKYKCLKKCQCRVGPALDSEKAGIMQKNTTVDVFEQQTTNAGVLRLRTVEGWVSEKTRAGVLIMELVLRHMEPVPDPVVAAAEKAAAEEAEAAAAKRDLEAVLQAAQVDGVEWMRSKVMYVGDGRAGKSHLHKNVAGEPVPAALDSTVGIDTMTLECKAMQTGGSGGGWSQYKRQEEVGEVVVALATASAMQQERGATTAKTGSICDSVDELLARRPTHDAAAAAAERGTTLARSQPVSVHREQQMKQAISTDEETSPASPPSSNRRSSPEAIISVVAFAGPELELPEPEPELDEPQPEPYPGEAPPAHALTERVDHTEMEAVIRMIPGCAKALDSLILEGWCAGVLCVFLRGCFDWNLPMARVLINK